MVTAAEAAGKDTASMRGGLQSHKPKGRQDGAILKAWAPMNPASATYQLGKTVAISSLSFLLCIGGDHDASFIWLRGQFM